MLVTLKLRKEYYSEYFKFVVQEFGLDVVESVRIIAIIYLEMIDRACVSKHLYGPTSDRVQKED